MDVAVERDSLRLELELPLARAEAFRLFAQDFGGWYPREYSWSGAALEWIGLEPREGGACYELGPHGFRCDWGRVLRFEPPARLEFSWQIGPDRVPQPDPARGSEVGVAFAAIAEGRTRVALEHRGFSRHGSGGEEYLQAMAAPAGWPYILGRYAAAGRA